MTFPVQQNRMNSEMVMDKIKHVTDDASLNVYDHVVHADDTDNAIVVTLPPVSLAAGQIYVIRTVDDSGSNGVDVIDNGDSPYTTTEVDPSADTDIDVSSAVAIDTAGDFLCMMSDGVGWIVLAHHIA